MNERILKIKERTKGVNLFELEMGDLPFLIEALVVAEKALEFYARPKERKVMNENKEHWIREYGCGCCAQSYDIDDDGSMGSMNAELDNVQGYTAREAVAKIKELAGG